MSDFRLLNAILFPSSNSSRADEHEVWVLLQSISENMEFESLSSDCAEHTETILEIEDARERPLREEGRERECTRLKG